jgi:hypothetical protein
MTKAQTILNQLGGNKFVAMTGATNLISSENGVSFKIGRNASKITHVRITHTAMDDYMVEFLKIRGASIHPVAYAEVQADNLANTFSRKTGMAVSL